jgi:hypothetical protein
MLSLDFRKNPKFFSEASRPQQSAIPSLVICRVIFPLGVLCRTYRI